jgi:hypothetical protein
MQTTPLWILGSLMLTLLTLGFEGNNVRQA